jgi:hypothetical protein
VCDGSYLRFTELRFAPEWHDASTFTAPEECLSGSDLGRRAPAARGLGASAIEVLEQVVGGQFNVFVIELCGSVDAGD